MQESAHPRGVTRLAFLTAAATAAVAFGADLATKLLFVRAAPMQLVPGILETTHFRNSGILASLPLPLWISVPMSLAVIAYVVYALLQAARRPDIRTAGALGLLLGGAIGNLHDRLIQGFVFDWLLLFGRSAVNLADAAIVLGALLAFWPARASAPPKPPSAA